MTILLKLMVFASSLLAEVSPQGTINGVKYRLEVTSRQTVRLELACPDKNVEAYRVTVVFENDNNNERKYTVERKDDDARSFVDLRFPTRDQVQIKSLDIRKLVVK